VHASALVSFTAQRVLAPIDAGMRAGRWDKVGQADNALVTGASAEASSAHTAATQSTHAHTLHQRSEQRTQRRCAERVR
jgi:hypothetical protein